MMGDVFPPVPFSWYAVGFERELRPGVVLTRRLADREIVLFRTESGVVRACEAYCPHLGAHLGHGGCVVGETIECPFHGFRFDAGGRCVSTPHGKIPQGASLALLPVRVCLGMIVVYHGPQDLPPWEIDLPEFEPGWNRLHTKRLHFRAHVQDMGENGIDYVHFGKVHKFSEFNVITEMQTDGPRYQARYMAVRPIIPGLGIRIEYEATLYGPGFSVVNITVQRRWRARQISVPSPLNAQQADMYIGTCMAQHGNSWRTKLFARPIEWLLGWAICRTVALEVRRDHSIWANKIYLARPRITKEDGPIGKYRRWVQQFYERAEPARAAETQEAEEPIAIGWRGDR